MINYNYADDLLDESKNRNLLLTDGTVTVSGTDYTVTGATITITNAEIDAESFELGQSICSGDQLRFGSCESGYIQFTMHENVAPIKGKKYFEGVLAGYDGNVVTLEVDGAEMKIEVNRIAKINQAIKFD